MKRLFLILSFSFFCIPLYAQTIYTHGARISADSITYDVSIFYDLYFELINIENELYNQDLKDLNGQPVSPFDYIGGEMDMLSFKKACTETFTPEELYDLKDKKTRIQLYLTKSNQGELLEVVFQVFHYQNPTVLNVPPEKFATFEKNLKQYVRWATITEDEKNLQFMHETLRVPFDALAPKMLIDKNPDAEMLPDSLQVYE
ncbi:MAG: hypothetical protein IKU77_05985 [Alistipes sp.]|nr:hypothetical protein [Alistipes sp.]